MIKKIFVTIIILLYLILIGDMVINNERYYFDNDWMYLLNLILLCLGFYCFIQLETKQN